MGHGLTGSFSLRWSYNSSFLFALDGQRNLNCSPKVAIHEPVSPWPMSPASTGAFRFLTISYHKYGFSLIY